MSTRSGLDLVDGTGRLQQAVVDGGIRDGITVAPVLLDPTITVPVVGRRPRLGTWQSLFLVELDGPRSWRLHVAVR